MNPAELTVAREVLVSEWDMNPKYIERYSNAAIARMIDGVHPGGIKGFRKARAEDICALLDQPDYAFEGGAV